MGPFLLGLILGAAGIVLLVIYDEGNLFLKLSRQIKGVAARCKQERTSQ